MALIRLVPIELRDDPSAGITFAGSAGQSTRFYFRNLVDWRAVGDSKTEIIQRPQAHGSFRSGKDFRPSLVISFEGFYSGTDRLDALAASDMLAGLANAPSSFWLTVTDEDGEFSREVSLRRIDPGDIRGQRVFTFTVYTEAFDPLRYGAESTVSTGLPVLGGGLTWPITWPLMWAAGGSDGRITLANPGTADAAPVLSVSGGLDGGFSLTEVGTGREVRFERLIPDGSVVVMDTRTGRAYIDAPGNDVTGFLTRSDWPTVPAGGSTVLQFNALGGSSGVPTLTGRTRPAYW